MDNVEEDVEAKKLNVQQAMVLVWDRNKWKHQVEKPDGGLRDKDKVKSDGCCSIIARSHVYM